VIKKEIQNLIEESIKKLQREGIFPMFKIPCFYIEEPGVEKYGDYSSNAALVLSKIADRSSREIAEKIEKNLDKKNEIIKKTEVAGAGFINFFISKKYLQDQIPEIIKQKKKFGALEIGAKQKVNIEFISANPTGPLTLGNGRGGFCGDVLANVLDKAGYKTTREYYINDRGAQITKLGHSVLGDSEAVYKGEYINNLRKELLGNPMSQLGHRVSQ